MPKMEVTWTRLSPEGEKRQVCARTHGDHWLFFIRGGRYEQWQELAEPPLEDWIELLDGVRRRGLRHRGGPRDEARLIADIRRRFPDAAIDP